MIGLIVYFEYYRLPPEDRNRLPPEDRLPPEYYLDTNRRRECRQPLRMNFIMIAKS